MCLGVWLQEQLSKEDMYSKEVRLCAQNMITILQSHNERNGGGGIHDHSVSRRIVALIVYKIII